MRGSSSSRPNIPTQKVDFFSPERFPLCQIYVVELGNFFCFSWVSNPLCLYASSALIFFKLFFRVHHLVNRDDRHLLAHALASDFSVAWQCLSKRTIFFCYGSNSTPFELGNVCIYLPTCILN
jgi:hypothetical protein